MRKILIASSEYKSVFDWVRVVTKSVFTPQYARFRKVLIAARKQAGLTQQQLADRQVWQQTDVSKVERGIRRLDVIEFLQFTHALNADAGKLLGVVSRR